MKGQSKTLPKIYRGKEFPLPFAKVMKKPQYLSTLFAIFYAGSKCCPKKRPNYKNE